MPRRSIVAESHDEFYEELAKLEKAEGAELVLDSIKCTISEVMYVPNPPVKPDPHGMSDAERLHGIFHTTHEAFAPLNKSLR